MAKFKQNFILVGYRPLNDTPKVIFKKHIRSFQSTNKTKNHKNPITGFIDRYHSEKSSNGIKEASVSTGVSNGKPIQL